MEQRRKAAGKMRAETKEAEAKGERQMLLGLAYDSDVAPAGESTRCAILGALASPHC